MNAICHAVPNDCDPASLVRRIFAGDRLAESVLIEQVQKNLVKKLCCRSGDPDLAWDISQDALCTVIVRLRDRGIAEPDKLYAFIERTAQNLLIAHYRKEGRRQTWCNSDLLTEQPSDGEDQITTLTRAEEGREVRKLLGDLRVPRDQELLERFYLWEQEKHLVCEVMQLSAVQFDRVVSRARLRMRDVLGAQPDCSWSSAGCAAM